MNRSMKLPVLAVALSFAASAHAETALFDAWTQLTQQNADLSSQAMIVNAEQWDVKDSKALRLPTVTLSGRWNTLDDDVGLDIDLSLFNPQLQPGQMTTFLPVQKKDFWDIELNATLPLYTGGAIQAAVSAQQADVLIESARLQQVEDDLFVTFVERYLNSELAKKNLHIHQQALENFEQHLNRAQRMYEEGSISLTEKLQAQVERDKSFRELQQAQMSMRLADSSYRALYTEGAPQTELTLRYVPPPVFQEADIVHKVYLRSPGLAQLDAGRKKAQAGIDATKASFLPTVAAFAKYELVPDDLTQTDPEWAAGIGFEWKLVSGSNRMAKTAKYKELEASTRDRMLQAKQNLSVLVEKTLLDIGNAEDSYQLTLSSQALADENLRLQTKAFEQGLKTSLDKIDAQLLLTGLQLEAEKALHDYYLALAKLYSLTGERTTFFSLMQSL